MKDSRFPTNLYNELPNKSYESIIKDLIEEMNCQSSAILLSGDLSYRGDVVDYRNCLDFLRDKIPINFFDYSKFQKIFIVPGNHDVDRKKFSDNSLDEKFEHIVNAIRDKEFPDMPLSEIKIGELHDAKTGSALIIAINSCVGCGERRYYPEEIQEAISKLLNSEDENKDFEDLDTPMFETKDIDELINHINSAGNDCIPLILAHHNLLTQKRPRIGVYTELINSGYMRERLQSTNRPVLYLHGHLHDDPIEIIRSAKYENSKIICICAPLLFPNTKFESIKFGFNKIKLVYSHDKTPIGCEITNYMFEEGNPEKRKFRIRFWDPPRTLALTSNEGRKIIKLIEKEMYFADLKQSINNKFNWDIPFEDLEKLVDELSWLGLVEYIKGSDTNPIPMRTVRKVVP